MVRDVVPSTIPAKIKLKSESWPGSQFQRQKSVPAAPNSSYDTPIALIVAPSKCGGLANYESACLNAVKWQRLSL